MFPARHLHRVFDGELGPSEAVELELLNGI